MEIRKDSDEEEPLFTIESLMAIYRRAPEFFRALALEDKSELYK